MNQKKPGLNPKQLLFKKMFAGSLIYAVVLGFFNDYTNVVAAKNFSIIFLAALLLSALTYLAFFLKVKIISWLKDKGAFTYRLLMFFLVWLVMFIFKFIFVWTIDFTFGSYMNIKGFFGILAIVVSVTILSRLADQVSTRLGDSRN